MLHFNLFIFIILYLSLENSRLIVYDHDYFYWMSHWTPFCSLIIVRQELFISTIRRINPDT